MASLVLGTVGQAIGASFGSFSVFGFSISGAQIGGAIGATLGMAIDGALMPPIKRSAGHLSDITIQSSTEGRPVLRLYGRMRVAGQIIWASRFKESSTTSGGKGLGSPGVETTTYSYSVSVAIGLCAGPVTRIGRIWADGNLLDPSAYTIRSHLGSETQSPDPAIEEIEGAGNTPAYRGLCYVVFEDMALAAFGNRIPQLQFEVVRALSLGDPAALENRLTAVALIPGAGEFVYAPEIVTEDDGLGTTAPLNAHNASGGADWKASLDELQALAPNLASVSLVVGWFGNDLRAGTCTVQPGVEESVRRTTPESWSVDGTARRDAYVVSQRDGRPAYGGTPSDDSVSAALADLKARGLAVTFYPFVLMDIAAGNALPNPYSNNAASSGQPAYPWRGRITVSPAAGFSGSADQTAAAAAQVNAFFNNGYRRMVLHYARLCAAAGGVEAFLIGSELVGLTRARSDASTYPAAAALKQLAADVRAILPSAKIGYGADWSEFLPHQTGGGALRFNLDPLWADANIDFVGIDNYLPLADWRDGTAHRDGANYASIYDPAYLTANLRGGEDFDWYYASPADRAAQLRTPITDGLGKPWIWRAKDFASWWSSSHYDRPSGTENTTPTAWVPFSKPLRFTELGCPAVDKGANQPNVFTDPKSAESAFPYFSTGVRDDLIQRRFLEAHLNYWCDGANNPVSPLYHGPMLETGRIAVWCWDARPYPFFPARDDVWGDAANYATGHWLNGRLGGIQLSDLVETLCAEAGVTAVDAAALTGTITGFAVTETASARDGLGPLMAAFGFDAVETEGVIRFVPRGRTNPLGLTEDSLVLPGQSAAAFSLTRAQQADLPAASRLSYVDAGTYEAAVAEARRLVTGQGRVASVTLPLVMDAADASAIGARLLQDSWAAREEARFSLPPSLLALDPADEVLLNTGGRVRRLRLTAIEDADTRAVTAIATDPSLYDAYGGAACSVPAAESLRTPGRPLVVLLDLPLLTDEQNPNAPFAAAFADPWPGRVDVYKDYGSTPAVSLTAAATIGETLYDFWSGPLNRWDLVNALYVKLYRGTLQSASDDQVFAGANALAVQNASGDWEVVQFAQADLLAPGEWKLSRLLRGRQGSETAMASPVAAGARVVLLDAALKQLPLSQAEARLPHTYSYGPAGQPVTGTSFQSVTQTFTAAGLMPPAPCHVRFAWSGGDLVITWLRRDRAPAANQITLAQTPQSDPSLFDLEILSGGSVVRTFPAVPQNSQLYTAAQQTADFPAGLPNPLTLRVMQRSSVVGRGRPKTETLYVR
jgi:hypothetical protein